MAAKSAAAWKPSSTTISRDRSFLIRRCWRSPLPQRARHTAQRGQAATKQVGTRSTASPFARGTRWNASLPHLLRRPRRFRQILIDRKSALRRFWADEPAPAAPDPVPVLAVTSPLPLRRSSAKFAEERRRGNGEAKEGMRCRRGGKRLGSYVEIGSCESEARVGPDGFQIEHEALGLGNAAPGQEL